MKLTSMRLSDKESKDYAQPTVATGDAPAYPWGLTINLENDSLNKLGMSDLPEVGQAMMLMAKVEVVGVSAHEGKGSKPSRSITLQITDMAIGEEGEKESPAKRLYKREA